MTNRRAIKSWERSYRNIWFEDLIDVFVGRKGNLVAKDRPRFGLPGPVTTLREDSQTLIFEALSTKGLRRFQSLLTDAKDRRAPLEGIAVDLGPY